MDRSNIFLFSNYRCIYCLSQLFLGFRSIHIILNLVYIKLMGWGLTIFLRFSPHHLQHFPIPSLTYLKTYKYVCHKLYKGLISRIFVIIKRLLCLYVMLCYVIVMYLYCIIYSLRVILYKLFCVKQVCYVMRVCYVISRGIRGK